MQLIRIMTEREFTPDDFDASEHIHTYRYCMNCGAEMSAP